MYGHGTCESGAASSSGSAGTGVSDGVSTVPGCRACIKMCVSQALQMSDFTKPQWSTQLYPLGLLLYPRGTDSSLTVSDFFLALESEVSTVGTTDTTSTVSARACQDQIKASWLQPIGDLNETCPFTQPCHHHPQPRGKMTCKPSS